MYLADGYSAAFSYEDDSLYLSYAMDKEILDSRVGGVDTDAMRFNARYKMGDMMISGMYQTAEPTKKLVGTTLDKEDSFLLSGSYKINMMTLRGEVLMSTQDMVAGGSIDTTLVGVGVDYNMTENTRVFGNLANRMVEQTAKSDMNTVYLGVGTEVRF